MSELVAGLIGGVVGGAFGVVSSGITAYLGPLKLEERKERRREEREDGPRKELLGRMLAEPQPLVRSFDRLKHVTGTTDAECRRLLIEIKARGVLMADQREGWALISRFPLDKNYELGERDSR